jgi:2-polyprenyl-3-methyl-5-hydroxy-6-metoxy-1,4-benzoquinol methylase
MTKFVRLKGKRVPREWVGIRAKKRLAIANQTWKHRWIDDSGRGQFKTDRTIDNYAENYGHTTNSFIQLLFSARLPHRSLRVLDAGCGEGLFLQSLKTKFGKDVTAEGISLRRAPKMKLIDRLRIGHLESFIRPKRYDVVVANFVIGHVVNPYLVLQNLANSVRPGGLILICDSSTIAELAVKRVMHQMGEVVKIGRGHLIKRSKSKVDFSEDIARFAATF